jgi:hypothetical protein
MHRPSFDEGCSELLDQRKQAKLQWLQDPREINGDNLNNIRRDASRYFRKKEGISERKINELATNYFSPLLSVHRVSDVRQIEIHTAELLVPVPSPFEVEIVIEN